MNNPFEKLKQTLTLTEVHAETSVLVPLCFDPKTLTTSLLLTKRTHKVETHKGQISFPGGYRESQDKSLLETALRETHEEIGVLAKDVEIAGVLSPVATRGGILISPWVANIPLPYSFLINHDEVEKLIFLPLSQLMQEGLKRGKVEIQGLQIDTPTIDVDGERIWGATAKIIEELRNKLLSLSS